VHLRNKLPHRTAAALDSSMLVCHICSCVDPVSQLDSSCPAVLLISVASSKALPLNSLLLLNCCSPGHQLHCHHAVALLICAHPHITLSSLQQTMYTVQARVIGHTQPVAGCAVGTSAAALMKRLWCCCSLMKPHVTSVTCPAVAVDAAMPGRLQGNNLKRTAWSVVRRQLL
jgi:hypothetical protein